MHEGFDDEDGEEHEPTQSASPPRHCLLAERNVLPHAVRHERRSAGSPTRHAARHASESVRAVCTHARTDVPHPAPHDCARPTDTSGGAMLSAAMTTNTLLNMWAFSFAADVAVLYRLAPGAHAGRG
jgi:hypothetical protein